MIRAGLLAALTLLAPAVQAASPQGFNGEQSVTVTGKVADMLCLLTGDCPADCGAGTRQLGVLSGTGTLYLLAKTETPFAGAVADFLPQCGKEVTIDGLSVTANRATILYADRVRETEKTPWRPLIGFIVDWSARNGFGAMSAQADSWWEHDPLIRAHIARFGKTGLGPK